MNTAVINIKIEPQVKKQAQKVAAELGLTLSSLVNGFLKHVIRTKTVTFSASEQPSAYMIQALKESAEDVKAERVTHFKSWEEEKDFLDKLIAQDEAKAIKR